MEYELVDTRVLPNHPVNTNAKKNYTYTVSVTMLPIHLRQIMKSFCESLINVEADFVFFFSISPIVMP